MGGFVSGPGGLMAWLLNIPLFVHEQNSIVGLTNRILSRFATSVYVAFPQAAHALAGAECIGNPVREGLTQLDAPGQRLQARIDSPLQLLVIGGSLGAAALESDRAAGDRLSRSRTAPAGTSSMWRKASAELPAALC